MFKKVDFEDLKVGDRVFVQACGCPTNKSINENGFIGYVYEKPIDSDNKSIGLIYVDIRWRSRRAKISSMWLDTKTSVKDLCEIRFRNDEYFVTDRSLKQCQRIFRQLKSNVVE